MLPETAGHAATFAAVFAALFVAHQVADHWIQTQHQADHKGGPGWPGRLACLAHVTTYTLTALAALLALVLVLALPLDPARVAAGLAVSAFTHYLADRRIPLRRMADAIGKNADWLDHGGGMYALDQSLHYLFLFVAALVIA
ncbi:DUF3307 domain-containing protein [Actinoplanes friuliensis]|uniref:DUF3307 domain-containing protein n=1 Tax=Actinoplanes friuliensis DSM 7358 TaxID=1246995 RepID=U5VRZ2_9ACTN|nr:DUF3307 domain-containing protein [Actinoplanes friuliensis]AGZ39604.1 hypothetical protein AFR_06575 [Actinoplanes friuliensis DSM 7358]